MPPQTVTLSVPATSANLGPGFDALGVALAIRNTFAISLRDDDAVSGETAGPEAGTLTFRNGNLVSRAFRAAWDFVRPGETPPGHHIAATIEIPQTRGLGSSSTALVAGGVAGCVLAGGAPDERLLRLIVRLEGHPDNVVPAFAGGLVCAAWDAGADELLWNSFRVSAGLAAVLVIPETALHTSEARAALPPQVPHADAVFNLARTPLVVDALRRGDLALLARASADRLHEPHRKHLIPLYDAVREVAAAHGGLPCALSGAGTTSILWAPLDEAESVAEALRDRAARERVTAVVVVTEPSADGWQRHA